MQVLPPTYFPDSSSICSSKSPGWIPRDVSKLDKLEARVEELECSKGGNAVYAQLLQDCGDYKCLQGGKRVHRFLVKEGLELDVYLGNFLVQMYTKCDRIDSGRRLFDLLGHRNLVSWNTLIAGYAENGDLREGLQLMKQMDSDYVKPNGVTFLMLLNSCRGLEDGRRIHGCVNESGMETNLLVGPALVGMYVRLGELEEGERVLKHLLGLVSWDVVAWNVVTTTYVHHGLFSQALWMFRRMQLDGRKPNDITFVNALGSCSRLDAGAVLHERVVSEGLDDNEIMRNALVSMYAKMNRLEEAKELFDERYRLDDVVSWNSMITAYVQNQSFHEAVHVFHLMQLYGVKLDKVTFVIALSSCDGPEFLHVGKLINSCAAETKWYSDIVLSTALVSMFGKCGSLAEARSAFESMRHRNIITWNSLIAAYAQFGQWEEAVRLFRALLLEGMQTSHSTYVSILTGFASQESLQDAKFIHWCSVQAGFEQDTVVGNALVNMYGNCKSLGNACRVFERMHTPNVVTWTSMIFVYVQHEQPSSGLSLFRKMQQDGGARPNFITLATALSACCTPETVISDGVTIHANIVDGGFDTEPVVAAAIVTMYGRCGRLEEARTAFERVLRPGLALFNAMISACSQEDTPVTFYKMLQECVAPNKSTLVLALEKCAVTASSLNFGRRVHQCAVENGEELDRLVGTALVNMYGKSGELDLAVDVFDRMPVRDVVTWNALLVGFAQHGHAEEALVGFRLMQLDGVLPDDITFVSVLLACGRSSSTEEGRGYFTLMVGEYGIQATAVHYGCLVDLLARRGLLRNAEELLVCMPFEPGDSEWMSLLSACKTHLDEQRGQRAAERVLELDPTNKAACVILSSILRAQSKIF